MSTFGGLNAAYTGLVAARTAIEVAGQNIANASTEGYTRQRVTLAAVAPLSRVGLFSSPIAGPGHGVAVTGIARLASEYLDARVRATASSAGHAYVRANALGSLEKSFNEPGDDGISAQLQDFWSSWPDLSNNSGKVGGVAAASAVISEATTLAAQLAQGYRAVANQWDGLRADAAILVNDLNVSAAQVADLNGLIRSTLNAGGSVNELLDQRSRLTTSIASIAGGTVNERPDGTVDVLIGGNLLVSGTSAHTVELVGGGALGTAPGAATLSWADGSKSAVGMDGGSLAGTLSLLSPSGTLSLPSPTGTVSLLSPSGTLADAADRYNALAGELRRTVNAQLPPGSPPFFEYDGTGPAATSLVVVQTSDQVAGLGAAVADAMSQLDADTEDGGVAYVSPDNLWSAFVTAFAVVTRSELKQSVLADLAATAASTAQVSNASVDLDEENVNLLMSQTAYQGSARVLTAMDEMLDTLINKTGLVGR